MKLFALLTTTACATLLLSGCEVRGPSVKVEPPKVRVDGVRIDGDHDRRFCPPGQAKKGNC